MGRGELTSTPRELRDQGWSGPRGRIYGLGVVGAETSVGSESGKSDPYPPNVLLGIFRGYDVCGPALHSTGFPLIFAFMNAFVSWPSYFSSLLSTNTWF